MPTLYLQSFTSSAHLERQRISVSHEDAQGQKTTTSLHLDDVDRVVLTGHAQISTQLLSRLFSRDVPVHFLSSSGAWRGSLISHKAGNAARRFTQMDRSRDPLFSLALARSLIDAKIRNQRRFLQRLAANRQESDAPEQTEVTRQLARLIQQLPLSQSLDQLRGYEGQAAALYFARLANFIPGPFDFHGRNRQPPLDPANSLLSWTYAIVQSEVEGVLRTHSLDPFVGFLHCLSYNTPSLALDLLEPLRAPVCDALALRLFNHKIIRPEHFEKNLENSGTYLNRDGRKTFFAHYEDHINRLFTLPGASSHTSFRKIIEEQTLSLIAHLEADAAFSPFLAP